jgi:ribonucleoside-diphosphate reductase alpha chain
MENLTARCEECEAPLLGSREEIFNLRYAMTDSETWPEACDRTAKAVAAAENGGGSDEVAASFSEVMRNFYFIPGGRIVRNAGRKKGMMINCFVLPVDDNIESIGTLYKEALIVSATGGGVGVNFSNLRPDGEAIIGKGGFSSGAVSFIEALDAIAETVESGGQRRAAFIGILRCNHPEIYKFIQAKVEEHKLGHFNISVGLTNEFLKAVKKNKPWELKFGNKVYDTVQARDLWDMLIHNAYTCGDPGMVNLDNLVNLNPLWYCEEILSTNPCGEIPLPGYGSCDLGSINLSEMYDPLTNGVNWNRLEEVVNIAVRLLDDVLDVTYYPLKDIELVTTASRRIGLGVMGLHYLLLKMGIERYGSDESLKFMDELFFKMRDFAYLASIKLAEEKGPFQKFDMTKYLEGAFAKTLPRRVTRELKKHGIRNGALLSMPPTGTTSIVAGVSPSLEPIFSPIFKRKFNVRKENGAKDMKEAVEVDPLFLEFTEQGRDTSHFVGAYEIGPELHMEVQTTIQKYVDNSISKTINMRKDYPQENLSELLLEHAPEIKGTTLYREGCKGLEILTVVDHTNLTREDILKMSQKNN